MSKYRYLEWDSRYDLLEPDADGVMDKLGGDLMASGDLTDCLQQMRRDGIEDSKGRRLPGAQALLDQLHHKLDDILREGHPQGWSEEDRHETLEDSDELSPEGRQGLSPATDDVAPPGSQELDKLAERLQNLMAQARTSLDSLSPEDRPLLENALQSALTADGQHELNKLKAKLEALQANDRQSQNTSSSVQSGLYDDGLELTTIMQKINELEAQLRHSRDNHCVDIIDERLLTELMGDETTGALRRLHDIPHLLDEAGYVRWKGDKCELSPQGMRKIGQKAVEDIFSQLRKDSVGGHNINLTGTGGKGPDETKRYEFGDDFEIHLQRTIMNSIYREPKTPPVKLNIEDFEVFKTEALTRSATVLMLDLSFSMTVRGHFRAAKQVAIALNSLIRSRYPKDSLYLVGFSSYARQIREEDLPYINWDESGIYTNIQHGLYIARNLLAKEKYGNKQIILLSDGEPTAHFEGKDKFFHQNPPSPRALQLTLREAKSCAQQGIVINIFMLENDRSLDAFVTQMARVNKGRVFFTNAHNLGQYLLTDYMANKRRRA